MPKVSYRAIKPEHRRVMMDQMAEVLATLNTKKEVKLILERLLTESEIVMLARHLKIADMLIGGLTYKQI